MTVHAPFPLDSLPWHEPPGHHASFSKYLVGLEEFGSAVEVRFSRCTPGGRVDSHLHDSAEHVYLFLEGVGRVTCDHREYQVERNMVLYVPAMTEHSVEGAGTEDLVFVVVTSPSGVLAR